MWSLDTWWPHSVLRAIDILYDCMIIYLENWVISFQGHIPKVSQNNNFKKQHHNQPCLHRQKGHNSWDLGSTLGESLPPPRSLSDDCPSDPFPFRLRRRRGFDEASSPTSPSLTWKLRECLPMESTFKEKEKGTSTSMSSLWNSNLPTPGLAPFFVTNLVWYSIDYISFSYGGCCRRQPQRIVVAFDTSETSPTASSQDSSMALCEEEPMAARSGGDDLIIAWVGAHGIYNHSIHVL